MKLNKLSLNAIGLNRIGLNRIGSTSVGSSATDRPYISPDVLSALAGVWISDGKSNTDPDRNIIKNKLPGRGGDFELLNFAYTLNSGYGKYEEDFTAWGRDASELLDVRRDKVIISDVGGINSYRMIIWKGNTHTKAFKAKVTGIPRNGRLIYSYAQNEGDALTNISIDNDGVYEFPYSYGFTNGHGFLIDSGTELEDWIGCTIEFIPSFQGSLCTDGVNDMIVSQNPVSEMLGGSNELTVVSMMCQISDTSDSVNRNNWLFTPTSYLESKIEKGKTGKTGIYGYTSTDIRNGQISNVNTILGDKNDYIANSLLDSTGLDYFSVEGFNNQGIWYTSSVAWYWTFISKRVLTTDEINQVIAYYNLDKYVKPDIYYNVKKQGLTNDTPDEDWYLKDFSGNGRDMTLYNYARTPESGINEEGGLQSDGVVDYGQFVGDLGLKDYTVVIDRAYPIVSTPQFTVTSDAAGENANTPFLIEHRSVNANESTYSYLAATTISINKEREICYQSTYQYKDTVINKGSSTSLGTGLTIARYGINNGYSALVLYSFMLFHYSMSKFLIERQLKKHKLGTLYPGMVEFRPIISGRTDLIKEIKWYSDSWSKRTYVGDYIPRGVDVTANILLNDNTSELVKATYGNNYTEVRKQANWSETNNEWDLIIHNIGKSPQKISITIDKYIRFEDIMQPYPVRFRFTDVDSGQVYDWGSKIKVGSTIKILSNVDIGNYLSDIYTITGYKYNGNIYSYNELKELTFLITNQPLEFASRKTYKLGGSEPKVILYPERLKLSNDTYKRLGYIPDLTGNGNHGVFNNLAFTEESGVNEDGSVHLDGVDDYINIPTLSKGGKQVLMKVNWSTLNGFIYDQRPASGDKTFGIYTQGDVIAYSQHNNGNTYIDGIINNNIIGSNLSKITHNIVATCDVDNSITPSIGKRSYSNSYFAQMALYAFMLFDEISTDEGIKDLNDIVGIVSKVELPPYYWDTYGKTNTDADRDEIVNLASDEVSIQYPTDFTDTSVWEDMGAVTSSTILTLTTWAMGGDTGIGNTIKAKVATPAMKVKFITDGNGYLDYMYSGYNTLELPRDAGEYEVELPASTIVDGWGARFSGSGNGSFIIELLGNEVRSGTLKVINSAYDEDSGYKNNGIALDGVDDSLVNTDIPAFTDFTVIAKRIFLGDQPNNVVFLFKGDKVYGQGVGNALLMEYRYDNGTYANYIFSNANSITLNEGDISYVTPTDYNGQQMNYVVNTDNKGLVIGRSNAVYWKGVFYKLMLYPKTIDILSINMLKNLFERDEIIDLNNPIFKKKEL